MSARKLPPPPDDPVRPPRVRIDDERTLKIRTKDGVTLEALGRFPTDARRAIVLCHPHPLYGGTMNNAVVLTIARALARQEIPAATLRFNFRGVEGSGGNHDHGEGEVLDVMAAIDCLRKQAHEASVRVIGYSFGALAGLRATWECSVVERLGLVAPAVRHLPLHHDPFRHRVLPTQVVVGDDDSLVSIEDATSLARVLEARLHVIKGAEHMFVGKRHEVARVMLPFVLE